MDCSDCPGGLMCCLTHVPSDRETYWGEPITEDERRLVEDVGRKLLYGN